MMQIQRIGSSCPVTYWDKVSPLWISISMGLPSHSYLGGKLLRSLIILFLREKKNLSTQFLSVRWCEIFLGFWFEDNRWAFLFMEDYGLKAQIKVQSRDKFQKLTSERPHKDKNVVSLVPFPNLSV